MVSGGVKGSEEERVKGYGDSSRGRGSAQGS